ncbi:MAG TPA: TIGR03936 family radical SAM-associated protein [Mycobacteriales bacterium]|jgi:radical SAM-linked protein|nr:TIGR03936 family radical SAM-associated protein [Mycobacteriales bacterium]
MSRRQPQTEVEPVVQRLRIRYAKRGRLRFVSHRDFARALERAIRRAEVPIAHSAGFSPHPKVSYVGAAPTGAASEAEYAELGLRRVVDPEQLRIALDAALPPGLDIIACVSAEGDGLADRVDGSSWRIELPGVDLTAADAAVAKLLAADSVPVERRTKSGRRDVDVRAGLISVATTVPVTAAAAGAPVGPPTEVCAILEVVVRHTTPAVRPDDVLAALRIVADLVPAAPARATRLAQGRLDDAGRLADPFAPDMTADTTVVPASQQ